ncbi:MAG: hypothetical protein ACKO1M_08035 [Planctomycetota bacterium]
MGAGAASLIDSRPAGGESGGSGRKRVMLPFTLELIALGGVIGLFSAVLG